MSYRPLSLSACAAAAVALAACHQPPVQPPPPPILTASVPVPPPPPPPPPPPAVTQGPCDPTMQLALETAIKAREKTELGPGMKAESSYTCMIVPEGGAATVPVTLASGRCYTFIAQSFPNVSELDLSLKPNFGPAPVPLLAAFANTPFAQDSDTGPAATIGKGANCFKNPLPVPGAAVVEVKARTGSGPVAVQVYSR